MNLTQCRFTHAGQDIRFTVYSDGVVATKLIDVISMEMIGQAELYSLEPSPAVHYIAIVENDLGRETSRYWKRFGTEFIETNQPTIVSKIKSALASKLKWRAA